METTYKGIIAGIGDKENDVNVISPEFDAQIRRLIIDSSQSLGCIINGFNLNGNILTAGACFAYGYIGYYPDNIEISDSIYYVYGKFTVNHDKNKPDSFEIILYENIPDDFPVAGGGADILNEAGTYYIPFIIYKVFAGYRLKYPVHAESSDFTTVVQADGKLENGVKATTQDVNDNSDKVATTEYVHNQIEEQIGYKTITLKLGIRPITGGDSVNVDLGEFGTLTITKKAKRIISIATLNKPNSTMGAIWAFAPTEKIPKEFLPNSGQYSFLIIPAATIVEEGYISERRYEGIVVYNLTSEGVLTISATNNIEVDGFSILGEKYISGWETNK